MTDEEGNTTLASECFECQPKAAPKSYPVCTIRNTPEKPIHCIVWAKDLLFQRLFGRYITIRVECIILKCLSAIQGRTYSGSFQVCLLGEFLERVFQAKAEQLWIIPVRVFSSFKVLRVILLILSICYGKRITVKEAIACAPLPQHLCECHVDRVSSEPLPYKCFRRYFH